MDKSKFIIKPKTYERKAPSKDSRKIYVYCEGSRRENGYFNFFAGLSTNVNIIPIPSKDGKTDPEKLMEAAMVDFGKKCDCVPKYCLDSAQNDMVWFVIDTDDWGTKICKLRNFCQQRNQEIAAWFVAQSNPCFEIWLFYHYYSKKPLHEEVKNFESMKNFVDSKIPGGFDSRKMSAKLGDAIENAKNNYSGMNGEPNLYSTEVYKLGEIIFPFVKDVL